MNELSRPMPERVHYGAPAVTSRWYPLRFWQAVLPILVVPQKLRRTEPFRIETTYVSDRKRWNQWRSAMRKIGAEPSKKNTSFTASATFCLFEALRKCGANIKNLRHYSTTLEIRDNELFVSLLASSSGDRTELKLEIDIDGAYSGGPNKGAVLSKCTLRSPQGKIVATQHDVWVLLNVRIEQTEKLPTLENCVLKKGLSKLVPQITRASELKMSLPHHAPKWFGRASGDLNPVHTGGPLASLLGYRKPFMQGFGTMNLVLAALDKRFDVNSIEMVFCRPLFVEECVELRVESDKFELVDEAERVISKGVYSA